MNKKFQQEWNELNPLAVAMRYRGHTSGDAALSIGCSAASVALWIKGASNPFTASAGGKYVKQLAEYCGRPEGWVRAAWYSWLQARAISWRNNRKDYLPKTEAQIAEERREEELESKKHSAPELNPIAMILKHYDLSVSEFCYCINNFANVEEFLAYRNELRRQEGAQ